MARRFDLSTTLDGVEWMLGDAPKVATVTVNPAASKGAPRVVDGVGRIDIEWKV